MTDLRDMKATFSVIDSHDHPHGGRILRLRLRRGEAPTVRELKSRPLVATARDGREARIRVDGFAAFGGRVTDDRLASTGRVDVHVLDEAAGEVDESWLVGGPA